MDGAWGTTLQQLDIFSPSPVAVAVAWLLRDAPRLERGAQGEFDHSCLAEQTINI